MYDPRFRILEHAVGVVVFFLVKRCVRREQVERTTWKKLSGVFFLK